MLVSQREFKGDGLNVGMRRKRFDWQHALKTSLALTGPWRKRLLPVSRFGIYECDDLGGERLETRPDGTPLNRSSRSFARHTAFQVRE